MSQNRDILRYLKKGKQLSPMQALERFECFRLAARVKNLRDAGHQIQTTMFHDERTGKRYALYWLRK